MLFKSMAQIILNFMILMRLMFSVVLLHSKDIKQGRPFLYFNKKKIDFFMYIIISL